MPLCGSCKQAFYICTGILHLHKCGAMLAGRAYSTLYGLDLTALKFKPNAASSRTRAPVGYCFCATFPALARSNVLKAFEEHSHVLYMPEISQAHNMQC